MSNYKISKHSYILAEVLGVELKPSTNPKKKIDVYKDGSKIASIGDINYKDYPTYLQNDGKSIADMHRKRYINRHKKDIAVINSNGWYCWKILWS